MKKISNLFLACILMFLISGKFSYSQTKISKSEFQKILDSDQFLIANSKFVEGRGIWKFEGWEGDNYSIFDVTVNKDDVIKEDYSPKFYSPKFSILSVPIKLRPDLSYSNKELAKNVDRPMEGGIDIKNIYLGVNFLNLTRDRYFSFGTSSTHRFSIGGLLGFTAIPLTKDNINMENENDFKDVTQVFFSSGVNVNYSYNNVNFSFVPFGWDFGLDNVGRSYVYHGKRWWGLGIGINLSRMGMPFGMN
ncbi:hypothetical protein [Algoriphagus mannitolivorans]|uniref:hypothetical protein n=1 Tax=Algoriphagus mannitolivorans TaxID=226504 RepID=UPI00041BCC78|nr:hypothetical protein [Algoriphagus mannitolivorans]